MEKRIAFCFLMALLIAQSIFAGSASAAGAFTDTRGHWAQKQIDELAGLGILKGNGKQPFYPDKPISRGEAIAMLNRVFESVYGPVAKPVRKNNLDYRYPLRWEIEQLLTNMRTMLQIETGIYGDYDPGDRMLYYLYIANSGLLIKKPEKENPDWWLSAASLQRPLSREEASMILFHMMTPQKFRTANIKPEDAKNYFTSYYEWKQESYYRDTFSPYATAIREFNLFSATSNFEPGKTMKRAEYAVVLKRLRDYFKHDATGQYNGTADRQQKMAKVYLSAASLAYETNNQAMLSKYFTSSALKSLSKMAQVPKHTDHTEITVREDESNSQNLWLIGQYKDSLNGTYQIEYRLELDPTSVYGRRITGAVYTQK
jgi:hypothetical protein